MSYIKWMIFSCALCIGAVRHAGQGEIQGVLPLETVQMSAPTGNFFPILNIACNKVHMGKLVERSLLQTREVN